MTPIVRFPGIILAVSIGVCLSGCRKAGPRSSGPRKPVIGFSQVGAESAWRTAETESVRSEARKRGVELILADAQGKQASQINALRSFVTQKVDLIVLAPVVETGWDMVLREARQAGIPVVLLDRAVKVDDEDLYVTLVTANTVEEGRMAARWLAEKTAGRANIVELQGTTGAAPAIDRRNGFAEVLQDFPEMKIIKSQSGDFMRAKGKEVMEAFIKSEGKRIQAVFAHNDDMALGAIQALEDAGMNPGKDVVLVSIDGVRAAFEAMVAGKLNATVECNPLFGPLLFDTIEKVLAAQGVPKRIRNEPRLFDQSVAADAIGTRKY